MSSFDFAQWPPKLTDAQIASLTLHATTYAFAHGLNYLPLGPQPPSPTTVIHAPIALVPSPVPRTLFNNAQRLQSIYNKLYARVATDDSFLDQVMGAKVGVGQADEFVRRLWQGWKQIREEGIVQRLHFGLFRSDYLLDTSNGNVLGLKQVEFNTISSAFGPFSDIVTRMHRYLYTLTDYYRASPYLKAENFPPNDPKSGLAAGFAEAHKAYGVPNACILFVVQPDERNVFDQRWLEYELIEKHGIRVIRQTFAELASTASLDGPSRRLLLTLSCDPNPIEISAIYFRAGYVPTDFPTETHWAARFRLERSRAIKCPTIPLQLAGGKKVQEALSQPGIVERFFPTSASDPTAASDVAALRETWMPMWALDAENPPALPGYDTAPAAVERKQGEPLGTTLARRHADKLVLKPQREGGGNNVYKGDIPPFLESLGEEERRAWIAMALIVPPSKVGSYLVRTKPGASGDEKRERAIRVETISELGMYGWALFGKEKEGEKEIMCKERGDVGWLMRTKGVDSNEGGVAAGFSVLDSVVLVDG